MAYDARTVSNLIQLTVPVNQENRLLIKKPGMVTNLQCMNCRCNPNWLYVEICFSRLSLSPPPLKFSSQENEEKKKSEKLSKRIFFHRLQTRNFFSLFCMAAEFVGTA